MSEDRQSDSSHVSYRDLFVGMTEEFRRGTEEYRRGNQEMAELRPAVTALQHEVHDLKETLEELAKAIRGDVSSPGMMTGMALLEANQKILKAQMSELISQGTPPSRQELRVLHEKDAQQDRRFDALEKRLDDTEKRRWEVRVAIIGAVAVAIASVIVGAIAVVLHLNVPKS